MSDDLGFRFTWYGHAAVHLESEAGTSIVVDPWFGHPLVAGRGRRHRALRRHARDPRAP